MFDRKYFEEVLPAQLKEMGGPQQPIRLTVQLPHDQGEYHVHALTPHEGYVVLKVHRKGKEFQHSRKWQRARPADDVVIFDQVCVAYDSILAVHLTAHTTKGDDLETRMGFQQT